MIGAPSASYSMTARVDIVNRPGMLGKVTSAIGKAGGDIGAIDLVQVGKNTVTRDITFKARDDKHGTQVVDRLRAVSGVKVVNVSDRTFLMHLGGKIEVRGKMAVKTRDDLSMAYTPGVARVCMAIHEDPEKAYTLTIKQNCVAVVTDGTAVLGLGGINLEDISAPRCFTIEERLKKELDIPVFHDDQHGTAVVVLAALINAFKIVKKRMSDVTVVFSGAGASATATAKLLMKVGVRHVIGADRSGILYKGRKENMNPMKVWFAEHTNPKRLRGEIGQALEGADVFIGLSGPGVVTLKDIKRMAREP